MVNEEEKVFNGLHLFTPFYFKLTKILVAAIAPWFRLRLPSCGPGFESQAHHQFVLLKLYQENNENKQKEAGIGPYLKKLKYLILF